MSPSIVEFLERYAKANLSRDTSFWPELASIVRELADQGQKAEAPDSARKQEESTRLISALNALADTLESATTAQDGRNRKAQTTSKEARKSKSKKARTHEH